MGWLANGLVEIHHDYERTFGTFFQDKRVVEEDLWVPVFHAQYLFVGVSDERNKFYDAEGLNKGLPEDASDLAKEYDKEHSKPAWLTLRQLEDVYEEDSKPLRVLRQLKQPGTKFLYKDDIRVILWEV